MARPPPYIHRTAPLLPYPTLFRSRSAASLLLRRSHGLLPPLLGPGRKARALFDHEASVQHTLLVKWLADNLQTKGKSLSVQTAGHRHGRKARKRCGHREHVLQIHGERISLLFTKGESGPGRRGRKQTIAAFHFLFKVARDQRPHLLRLRLIGIGKHRAPPKNGRASM